MFIFLFHCSRLLEISIFLYTVFFEQSYVFRHPPVKWVFSVVRFGDWCLAGQEPLSSSFPVLCGVLNVRSRTLLWSLQKVLREYITSNATPNYEMLFTCSSSLCLD